MQSNRDAYEQLSCYTLTHGDPAFIHQHVVDAFAAQDSGPDDKPIRLTFALVGLYLHVEKGLDGRQIQKAHMRLAATQSSWPSFRLPENRGEITAATVLEYSPGLERDQMIHRWCDCTWKAFSDWHDEVEKLLNDRKLFFRNANAES